MTGQMQSRPRPGGLVALAVLNFVFAGLGLIGLLFVFGLLSAANQITGGAVADTPGAFTVVIQLLLGLAVCALLIAAGVGYLGQKKFSGQTLGNVYAVVSILSTLYGVVLLSSGFGIFTIIGLIYPVLTLILLNTTFKDDFVNP